MQEIRGGIEPAPGIGGGKLYLFHPRPSIGCCQSLGNDFRGAFATIGHGHLLDGGVGENFGNTLGNEERRGGGSGGRLYRGRCCVLERDNGTHGYCSSTPSHTIP